MENPPEGAMMEERAELMAAVGAGKIIFRTAHYLKATHSHQFDAFPLSSNSNTPTSPPPKVAYQGWRGPLEGWERWVHRLEPVYGEIWKTTGIYGAILASTYNVVKCRGSENLMLKLAEKWCPNTNTFLFPWGECTVTLEDVMILGGFPVLGELVFRLCGSDEMPRLEKKLSEEHLSIRRNSGQPPREGAWLDHFMGCGSEKLEHEAFLVLWLTRYVFPNVDFGVVDKGLFLIAINLSRGIRVALGPAVLASIYRDLGFLKKASLMGLNEYETLILCSPLGIVKVWAWERFPRLRPTPKIIEPGEPRLARWNGVSSLVSDVCDVSEVLNSSGKDFQWRPFVRILKNWDSKKLYNEKPGYIMAGSKMDSDVVRSLVRCWRNSELVGMDCMEQYLPHRVGMQFGFDQDLPGLVERLDDANPELAWLHYNRPVKDTKIYVPARLSKPNVTKRYHDIWTRAEEMGDHDPNPASGDVKMVIRGIANEANANENLSVQGQMDEIMEICEEDPLFPPGFGPKAVYSSDHVENIQRKGLMMEVDSSHGNGNGSLELEVESGTPAGVDFVNGPSETRSQYHDQPQRGNSRNNSNSNVANGEGSSRLYTIEEVADIITDMAKFLGRG